MTIVNELLELIKQGGYAFMIPLILMSFLSLATIMERLFALRKEKIVPANFEDQLKGFDQAGNKGQGKALFRQSDSLVGLIINKALDDHRNGNRNLSLEKCLENSAGFHLEYLSRRLWILNAIGNLAPLLGLLGTVVGLAIAFEQIGISGLSQESVASGIAIALITTITGLSIAIPTLFALYGLRALGERRYQYIKLLLSQFLMVYEP